MDMCDYKVQLERLRTSLHGASAPCDEVLCDNIEEALCCCALLAEEHLREQECEWEIASLAEEFLRYATLLVESDYRSESLLHAAERMNDTIFCHPRLKVRFMRFIHNVMERYGALEGREALLREIEFFEENIRRADRGALDEIVGHGHLKHDPIEWTLRWEQIIDQADEIVYKNLADYPRGLGFCHAFWAERTRVLRQEFGLKWRSLSRMNPHVIFD